MEYDGYRIMKKGKYHALMLGIGEYVYMHRYVWEQANGSIPAKMLVHHIDGDEFNNALSNLELMSYTDHKRLHMGWTREGGEWYAKPCKVCGELKPLTEFYRMGKIWQAKCKPCCDLVSVEYDKNHIESTRKRKRDWARRKKSLHPVSE